MRRDVNETLTRVGPETPIGALMREYWLPAVMSSELKPDGAPLRLMLLGERLIAFRDSSGRVGILHHLCPHRCASLFLARNEHDGLRCVFHGWKFDVEGRCVDMPNVPPAQDFKERVRAPAYPTVERGGVVWVYMGARAQPPALPMIEVTMLPEHELVVYCMQRDANWLQVMEGDLDTGHFGFLHLGSIEADQMSADGFAHYMARQRFVELNAAEKPWGAGYAARQPVGDDRIYWRFANFMFPFWAQNPQSDFADHVDGAAFVPMDDTHTMVFRFHWIKQTRFTLDSRDGSPLPLLSLSRDYLPNTTDWFGRWRAQANEANDWMIDRQAQSEGRSFSGIDNLYVQDQAVAESAGPILDRTLEHLCPTDLMVATTRQRLYQAALDLRDKGATPPGVDNPEVFLDARGGSFETPPGVDWEDAYEAQMRAAIRPGLAIAAE
jgi:phenylpropionate dioxygenase-like ring-hydroxylating dioxygenase large terminal subunit